MTWPSLEPVTLSLTVALSATALALPPALACAWLLERTRFRGRGLLHGLVLLPLVLPPVVTGYLLLALFSPRGTLGAALASLGMPVAFHWLGAVLAAAVVGFPLLVMFCAEALRSVDPGLETMAASLGHRLPAIWWRVTLPLAWPGIVAGVCLCFARALGEFGATIVLAGHVDGETATLPLAVHAALSRPGGEDEAAALVVASIVMGLLAVVAHRVLASRHARRLGKSR